MSLLPTMVFTSNAYAKFNIRPKKINIRPNNTA